MTLRHLWLGLAGGIIAGVAIVAIVGVSTQTATAQSPNFTVTPAQLKINQNISSAAVKRSNRALNYLAPIRTTASDNADDGSGGVKPLSGIAGSGQGWTVSQLAKGQKQYWLNVNPTGGALAQSSPTSAFTATRTGTGDYLVDFKTDVSACSWAANPYFPAPPGAPVFAFTIGVPGQPTQVTVRTYDQAASAFADSFFTVRVLC
jgi:hypothetical protein